MYRWRVLTLSLVTALSLSVSVTSRPGVAANVAAGAPAVSEEHAIARPAFGEIQGDEFGPAVGFDGVNFLVVWEDFSSGTSTDIFATRVDRTGTVLDPAGIRVSTAPGQQFGPAVGFDGTNYLVVWRDFRAGINTAYAFGARVSTSGTVLDPDGIVISPALNDLFGPAVSFDGTNFLVVWQAFRFDAPTRIVAARVNQAGTVLDPAGISVAPTSDNQFRPAVAFDGTNYLVVWTDSRSGPELDIFGARVSRAGAVLDPAGIPISAHELDQEFDPAIAFTGTNYFVVWAAFRSSANMDIFGTRVTPTGLVRDPGGIPISTAPEDQFGPAVVPDGRKFLVAWTDRRAVRSTGSDIVGATVFQNGVVRDRTGFVISAAPGDESPPALTNVKRTGRWGVVYQRLIPEPPPAALTVFLRTLRRP